MAETEVLNSIDTSRKSNDDAKTSSLIEFQITKKHAQKKKICA